MTSERLHDSPVSYVCEPWHRPLPNGTPSHSDQTAQQILELWRDVPEEHRGSLIAVLLHESRDWHEYAVSPQLLLSWLQAKFEDAQLSFPERVTVRLPRER